MGIDPLTKILRTFLAVSAVSAACRLLVDCRWGFTLEPHARIQQLETPERSEAVPVEVHASPGHVDHGVAAEFVPEAAA